MTLDKIGFDRAVGAIVEWPDLDSLSSDELVRRLRTSEPPDAVYWKPYAELMHLPRYSAGSVFREALDVKYFFTEHDGSLLAAVILTKRVEHRTVCAEEWRSLDHWYRRWARFVNEVWDYLNALRSVQMRPGGKRRSKTKAKAVKAARRKARHR